MRTSKIYYGLIYRPPTGNLTEFLNKIEEMVTNFRAKSLCEINRCGDMNIDLLKNEARRRQYLTFLRRLGLSNVIREVTLIKQQELGFSLTDHCLTTDEYLYAIAGALPTNASDHCSLYSCRKKTKMKHPKSKFKGRAYSRLNQDTFKSEIENNNWTSVYASDDSNVAWNLSKTEFTRLLHKNAPMKILSTNSLG